VGHSGVALWPLKLAIAANGAGAEANSDPGDIYWSDQFYFSGANGVAYAAAWDANGNVYTGGSLSLAGGVVSNCIVK